MRNSERPLPLRRFDQGHAKSDQGVDPVPFRTLSRRQPLRRRFPYEGGCPASGTTDVLPVAFGWLEPAKWVPFTYGNGSAGGGPAHSPTGLSSVEIYEDIYTRETHGPVFAPRTEMLSEAPSLASLTRELASGAPDPSGSIENRGRPS